MYSHHHAVLFPLLIGALYYLGAYVGVHFAALDSGIVVLWPPNAVLLAGLLSRPPRSWWPLAMVVLAAEVAADIPVFTITQALLFGAVNITECVLAAGLMRFFLGQEMDWHRLKDLSVFLVTVFFIASPIAALGGASVYSLLVTDETPFLTFWRLWWIGDATGLVILTPLIHMLFNAGPLRKMARTPWFYYPELIMAGIFSLMACYLVFSWGLHSEEYLALTPLIVVLAPIWVAVRFGPMPGSFLATMVALYVSFATAAGVGPFIREQQERSALLTQEFVVLFIVMVLYLAAFVHQNRRKSYRLRKALAEVKLLNAALEDRVRKRTSELFAANRRLTTLALTDELTGIANRRQMRTHGEEEVRRSDRSQHPFSVLLLDIDHFKRINDLYGHDIGDRCLQAFARATDSVLRSVDLFGRWGGEEFIIIVPDSEHVDLLALSEKLLDHVRNLAVPVEDNQISMTVSIGIAQWHGTSFDRMISEADDALYEAKAKGRDRAEFATT
ncbi:diguanylate cyclase [Marinobacter sp. TBZ242]|uniref:diguanylate cyclase n=1 Tax=Marinobacter azerbaijanicus TaxID=3050455 RepID=A0ABT7IGK6_9GAMM|nr:diguanylate cyclase [Marinobacter sp. TBZ242]MDL0432288.1 diguanylate cyclase [Marinobacter sp. TBZ242]